MSKRSLEDLLGSVPSPVELLRNSQAGPNVYPGVPAEYTNWRDEQTAWQQTCVLFNQSFHMADLAVEGPDAEALRSVPLVIVAGKRDQYVTAELLDAERRRLETAGIAYQLHTFDGGHVVSRSVLSALRADGL